MARRLSPPPGSVSHRLRRACKPRSQIECRVSIAGLLSPLSGGAIALAVRRQRFFGWVDPECELLQQTFNLLIAGDYLLIKTGPQSGTVITSCFSSTVLPPPVSPAPAAPLVLGSPHSLCRHCEPIPLARIWQASFRGRCPPIGQLQSKAAPFVCACCQA